MIETFLRSTRAQGGVVDRAVTDCNRSRFCSEGTRSKSLATCNFQLVLGLEDYSTVRDVLEEPQRLGMLK